MSSSSPTSTGTFECEPKLREIINAFNSLEVLFKKCQLIQNHFYSPVLNEYRYFARALVDIYKYQKSDESEKKNRAYSRAEVSLSVAYNDILDSILNAVKKSITELRKKYWDFQTADIYKDLDYKEIHKIITEMERVVASSRGERAQRIKIYKEFAESTNFDKLIEFTSKLPMLDYLCELSIDSEHNHKKRISLEINKALKHHDKKQTPRFELYLQPKFNVAKGKSRKLAGVEALLRFFPSDSEYMLTPYFFFQALVDNYLEQHVFSWVLDESVLILDTLQERGIELKDFAINVEPILLKEEGIVQKLNTVAIDKGITNILSIEIMEQWGDLDTEGDFFYKVVNQNLNQTLHKDIRIAIDDFGAGSTKIHYLAMIKKLTTIKIDKQLIDGLLCSNYKNIIKLIRGLIGLAKEMKFKTVAEGVETKEQYDKLINLGIDQIQGFYCAKPMSVDEFIKCHKDNPEFF